MKNQVIKCLNCQREGTNLFADPFDTAADISPYHSKRCETEYCFKCPHCGGITIYPNDPTKG